LQPVAFACVVVCPLCDILGVHSAKGLKMIKRGDRVKLTARVAAAFNNNKRPGKFDWVDRRGVVERITANKAAAIVLWDGRKSADDVPIRSIELEPG
jgi:hypothetical protein